MKKLTFIFLIIPCFIFGQTILSSLDRDLKSGNLDYEEYLVNRVLAINEPMHLQQSVSDSMLPIKSGTFITAEAKYRWESFSLANQQLLKSLFARPEMAEEYVSPSGQFKIHYDTNGTNAVSASDLNGNSIPDYIEKVAVIFDSSHAFIVDTLGYQPPPSDRGVHGDEYDVYVKEFYTSMYGQTVSEEFVNQKQKSCSSYIEIDNNYKGFLTSGLNGLRVTAAHEYFHAIQFGYTFDYNNSDFWKNNVFFYEISSTWMEDMVYDDVNDYYYYMTDFYRHINRSFTTYNGSYEYGNCVWNHMVTKKYGPDVIRSTWEKMIDFPVLTAMDQALASVGSSFQHEFAEYAVWNYFTGNRADSINYYPEGSEYPEVRFNSSTIFSADTIIAGMSYQLAYSYYNFIDPLFVNDITFIPVNNENTENIQKEITFRISRTKSDSFKTVADDFNVNLILEDQFRWQTNIILENADGEITIFDYESLENEEDQASGIISFGPNPLDIHKHKYLNIYYNLKKASPLAITLFNENGYKMNRFEEPMKSKGENLQYSIDQKYFRDYPGGIYLILFETNYSQDLVKIAIIR